MESNREPKCYATASRLEDFHVIFSVQDTGSGIPEDQKQVMTDKFGRMTFENAFETALVQPGFGLGLAFCKLATDAMKGRIWVNSKLGHGSTFFVAFPVQVEPEHKEPATVSRQEDNDFAPSFNR